MTVCILSGLFCSFSQSSQAQTKNILFLNSYHAGYKWSDELYQGFIDSLNQGRDDIAIHVEYLDMKRYYSEEKYAQLAEVLALKYRDIPIDLLVSSDDAAFILLQRYASTIFPDVPVFFCGTNYLNLESLQSLPQFRGINETADIESTFATILKLLPTTRQIYIISDLTVTGQMVRPSLEQAISRYEGQVNFFIWDNLPMTELLSRVRGIPQDDSVIFYTFFFRDSTGQNFEYYQSIDQLYQNSHVPIFGAWDFNLGLGLTGGMLTSGYQQGKAVANLVNSWLSGTPLSSLPLLASSPNHFSFDYKQLEKYTIPAANLPLASIVINRPTPFLTKHHNVLIISGIFISLLLLVIVILTVNIFRRKKIEKELSRSEENFRSIFNNANDGLYQADADGRFIRVNPALAKMLKFSTPTEVVDHFNDINTELFTSPTTRKAFLSRHQSAGWAKGEHCLFCHDGSIINVIENTHTVFDEQGLFLYHEGSMTDITEYKKTQELIAQTEKIISLGGVAAGIAHEIRSPLSSIVQGVQVVQNRISAENPANSQAAIESGVALSDLQKYLEMREIPELLNNIYDSGRRAGIIIEDMLSFSRKTIGDFSMECLEKLLEMSLDLARKDHTLKTRFNFRTITIIREYDADIGKVYCSGSKLQQVFFNILKNGAEAMGETGTRNPEFILRIKRNDTMARVEIEDNGPGMSLRLQQQVFDPFFTTKNRDQGTGLGLSVSYFIIKENHHGDLQVRSQPGQGSTFIIDLPLDAKNSANSSQHELQELSN